MRSTVQRDRTGPVRDALVALPGCAGAAGAVIGAAAEVRGTCRRPAHQRAVKYSAASVTAQLATTLCATSVPTIRLTQNSTIRRRSMGVLSSACSADTENAPAEIHEGIGEDVRHRELRSSEQTTRGSRRSIAR